MYLSHTGLTQYSQLDIAQSHRNNFCSELWCCCRHRPKRLSKLMRFQSTRPLQRKDIYYGHKVERMAQYDNSLMHESKTAANILYQLSTMNLPDLESIQKPKFRCSQFFMYTLNLVFDFSLLKSFAFYVISFHCFFFTFGLMTFYVYATGR